MISSLKRALQPAVTDLSIKFDVPSSFIVYQAPEEVPTLFSGDKVVVYGIMKQQKSASDQSFNASMNGTATLTGHILSKPIQFKLTFDILPPSDFQSSFGMPIIHQLASKALIHELQSRDDWTAAATYEQRKNGIVNLSIESGVVSAHTAYIALDEEQEKLMEGAVKTWDVVATMAQHRKSKPHHIPPMNHHLGRGEMIFSPTQAKMMFPPIPPRGDIVATTVCHKKKMSHRIPTRIQGFERPENMSCTTLGKVFPPAPPRPLCEGAERMITFRARNKNKKCKDDEELRSVRNSNDTTIFAYGLESSCSEDHLGQDVELRFSRLSAQSRPSSRANKVEGPHTILPVSLARKRKQRTVNPQVAGPKDNLKSLILFQKLEGFWDIDMLQWLDFPIPLQRDNIQLCATVYALAYMKIKFASRCDEWELVARKAEAWLECQTLPDQIDLEELKKEASDYIITNLVE